MEDKMSSLLKYKAWLENEYFDSSTRKELEALGDNPAEIEERFYKDLEFGTGGLRGIIGAGTNRMNIYTVRKASQGLANYVLKNAGAIRGKGIVIAYDSRHMSPEFALEAALTFAGNGIKTWVFNELRPTPQLSFAVRYLKAAAGIVVTASHNPRQYNGYKVYGEDGAQLSLDGSEAVLAEIEKISDITGVKPMDRSEAEKKGLLQVIGAEIDDAYMRSLHALAVNREAVAAVAENFKIIFTPLHGAGNKPVRRILEESGFKRVLVVKEQELPDPDFSTVRYPNPEERDAFKLAIELASKENADLIIGTDPDCDRVGVVVRNSKGEYVVLTGNQTGCLLMEYILSGKKAGNVLPPNGFTVKTIVTSELGRAISQNYGIELVEVLTGFKFIGEKIKELDEFGDRKYLFGFEESYGYLAGTAVRDKDGVVACMLICEMAAYYKTRGMSLYEGLEELFQKYGYYVEGITSFTLEGKEGIEKIECAMKSLRAGRPGRFNDCEVAAIRDYLQQERLDLGTGKKSALDLPQSNVLYYEMKDGSWFCIRPSGTEPKIKVYYGVSETGYEPAQRKLEHLKECVIGVIKGYL